MGMGVGTLAAAPQPGSTKHLWWLRAAQKAWLSMEAWAWGVGGRRV